MPCFYFLVHGRLRWHAPERATDAIGSTQPSGFYCHRYVFARDEQAAFDLVCRRVTDNLNRQFDWFARSAASVELEAEEVAIAPFHKVLRPDNKGYTFYERQSG